jgi:hypothetical protein
MSPTDEMAAKPDAAGFGGEPDQQLRTILENLQRVGGAPGEEHHAPNRVPRPWQDAHPKRGNAQTRTPMTKDGSIKAWPGRLLESEWQRRG